ncbi:MAG: SAM-dependent methyltransferase, partial [Candidatus Hecatellaceae archaeon]
MERSDAMKVYFIGFGPGDPELLTIKAYKILKQADLIIYPGSLIDEKFLEEFNGRKVNSYGMKLEEIIELIESNVKAGKIVARIVSGDPSIFSALNEQIIELEKRGFECEIIPGVSSI